MTDRGNGSKTPLLVALGIGGLLVGVLIAQFLPADLLGLRTGSTPNEEASADAAAELWTCGMHPQVIEEGPGQCPICGMDLTPMQSATATSDAGAHAGHDHGGAPEWTCVDHEMIVESEPGTCPIDGLDLVPVETDTVNLGPGASPDRTVTIDPSVVQTMNVRAEAAQRRDLTRSLRTVGYLEFDQQSMVTVTTKYSGWIETVYVNYVGEAVRKGQPLFEIYSPELVQTERELLAALAFANEMESAPEDARQRARSMVEAARIRLGYWDVTPEQITRLEQTGQVFRTLTVSSPASGVVMMRKAGLDGMAVQPGMGLFHLANLSSLWLSVEIYEDQLAVVREGSQAEIRFAAFPGETFRGRVRYFEPELSEETRTLRAMIEVPNRGGRLRKGMYATVELRPIQVRDALTVPLQAVLRTGRRNAVVVDRGEGRFEPRDVVLGHESEGYVEVLEGLDEGERVVTSAQFLLDSESSLQEAVRKMLAQRPAGGGSAEAPTAPTGHAGHAGH